MLAQPTSPLVSSFLKNPTGTFGAYLSFTLYVGTLFPDTRSTIPTVTDNSFAEGTIAEKVLSISFEPITTTSVTMDGELTWGLFINCLKP